MKNGFAIALAWPETVCKQAGAWYDLPMRWLKINKRGYYKVGHAAIVLVDDESGTLHYFDFGRYHAPKGFGRVRSKSTDHELELSTKAVINHAENEIVNLDDILAELFQNPSTHGTGVIFGSPIRIDYEKATAKVEEMRNQEFIPYGPFVRKGTNCSRFVCTVINAGLSSLWEKLGYVLPLTITPTPMWNLIATKNQKACVGKVIEDKIAIINENKPLVA